MFFRILTVAACCACMAFATGCGQQDEPAEEIREEVEEVGDEMEDVADEVSDAVEDAADEVSDEIEN